jgi:RNA polymerase sigma-70 factor (ECF subfamily)
MSDQPAQPAPLTPQTTESLCQAAIGGDAEALEALLQAFHRRFLGFAARKVGVDWRERIEPEDVLQEAYVSVFRTIQQFEFRGEDSFYHWVTRIIDHAFVDQVRRLRRKKRDVGRETRPAAARESLHIDLLERCAPDSLRPSRNAQQDDAVGHLMRCIARLPDHYRIVIQGVYLDQRPVNDLAAELGKTPDAVRRIGSRALEQLARCLGRASRYLSTMG